MEEYHLATYSVIFEFPIDLRLKINPPVWHVSMVSFIEHSAVSNILLCNQSKNVVHMNKLTYLRFRNFFEVPPEPRLGRRPVSNRHIIFFTGRRILGLPPISFDGGVSFKLKTFLYRLTAPWVIDKLRHSPAISNCTSLISAHVVRYAMLRLT